MHRLLAALIVLATVGFLVGVSLETNDERAEPATEITEAANTEAGEFQPLGINLESTPLIVLAALASILLAAAAWTRPRWLVGLGLVAVAMGAFAALDLAELVHQTDAGETGLAVLAAVVAVLHVGAALLALRLVVAPRS